ncbi:HdeD family acid-resistance protein [Nodosilinea sp. LEGE 07088]|uniref:HdeD family acid-resistance protein n=1 Tax=Nodosilinea sp. LEGE 07088 TaxID=2777968 RepID=UPI00188051EE|nr:HdeD family acid-resistance protein [Nodosilinea sp. LEGE 07088]MBE9137800.1 HdeD family acid-resistance protein [Nodosilinea sp. LEGE 07088]
MTTDFLSSEDIKKSTTWVIVLSIVLIILGIFAILSPAVASAFFTATMGWIALISGIMMIVQSFRSHPVRGFWLNLIVGILYAIAGLYILFNLGAALLALTLAFGILFVVEGIFTIIMGFTQKAGRSMSWLVVLNGVVTLILGIMVLNRWPVSALWLIGLYVGISLLFSGISLLAAALATRKTVADAPGPTAEA